MRNLDDEDPFSGSLAGSLLVAHPNMLDPNFRRTVLFISEHDPNEGALGVIINRPLDRQVADLVTETPPAGLADVPVFLGGPVGKSQLMFAAFEWKKGDGLKLSHNVALESRERRGWREKAGYNLCVCRLRRLGSGSARNRAEAESLAASKSQSFAA